MTEGGRSGILFEEEMADALESANNAMSFAWQIIRYQQLEIATITAERDRLAGALESLKEAIALLKKQND